MYPRLAPLLLPLTPLATLCKQCWTVCTPNSICKVRFHSQATPTPFTCMVAPGGMFISTGPGGMPWLLGGTG